MKKIFIFIVVVGLLLISNLSSADVIRGINIEFVNIGNAGNAGDTRDEATPYNCGAVNYNYYIGKYEVTNFQWNAFTAVSGMPAGNGNGDAFRYPAYFTAAQQPTNNVSWYEATQFCNYLTSGDKSKGAYQFSGNNATPDSFLGINRVAAQTTYSTIYVLPTEDEWYKAAYYKPDGSGYSLYANGTNTAPIAGVQSNFNGVIGAPWNVGSGMKEQNGTFDIMGNVYEWNEAFFPEVPLRGERGGCFGYSPYGDGLTSAAQSAWTTHPSASQPYNEYSSLGFRIVYIPEPTTISLLGLGLLALRRKK